MYGLTVCKLSCPRGNQCWIPYQIGQRYTKNLTYHHGAVLSLLRPGLCTLLALFQVWWWWCAVHRPDHTLVCCIDRYAGDLLDRKPGLYLSWWTIFFWKGGLGLGGASAGIDKVILAGRYCQRDRRILQVFWVFGSLRFSLSFQLSAAEVESRFSSSGFSRLALKSSTHKENAQSSFSMHRVRPPNGLMGSGEHKKYEVQGQLHFTLEFFYLLAARMHSLESPTNMLLH